MTAAASQRVAKDFPRGARARLPVFPSRGLARVLGVAQHPGCPTDHCVIVRWPAAVTDSCESPTSLEIVP